jgi:hypothetical protein
VTEVAVKLIQEHVLARRLRCDLFRVEIRILPCPAYFDQVLFTGTDSKRKSIARACVNYYPRVSPCDMRLNRKAHAGAIAGESGEIKTERFQL